MQNFGGETWRKARRRSIKIIVKKYVTIGSTLLFWLDGRKMSPCNVRHHLKYTFYGEWFGRGGPVGWPAWSPLLKPLEVWLGEQQKTLIYSDTIDDYSCYKKRLRIPVDRFLKSGGGRVFERGSTSCNKENWVVFWHPWEPHRGSAIEIRRNHPYISSICLRT
jgi:hypothetical protein